MFATVAARAVSSIFTNAMTTRFTPPASCKTHWTYEAPYYNSVSNGILVQNQVKYEQGGIDTDCFPSGWRAGGRAYSIQVWSPGACPVSYTTVTEISDSGTTTGVCCYSSFSYYGTISTINYGGTNAENFVGCISTLPAGNVTRVPGLYDQHSLSTTQVTGPITLWAQALTIEYRLNDLALFPALTSSESSVVSTSSAVAAATPSSTFATATSAVTTSASTLPSHTSSKTSTPDLSTGAKAGIGIGVTLSALALLLAIFCAWKVLCRRELGSRASQNLHIDHKPLPLSDRPWRNVSIKSTDHIIHQLPADREPVELYGRTLDRPIYQLSAEPEPSELYGSTWQKEPFELSGSPLQRP
ncbi:hypothetical protein IWZ01DRAFT_529154 [Phyllosticta capitalensis]